MASFWLPGASRCRLCAALRTARAHEFSQELSLAHYPSRTRLPQTKLFCIQALWQCLSMTGKPRPLEALNSIVSAGPGTSAETRVARMESEFTAQSPLEGARSLKKSASLCEECPLRCWRIWGSDSAYLRRRCLAKRPHLPCLESK
jgi:hypothetical protein